MELLSSKENSIIKSCKALAESASERRKQGLVFLEGARLCGEASEAGAEAQSLLVTEEAWEKWQERLLPLSQQVQSCYMITPQLAKHISETQSAQGVYCVCTMPKSKPADFSAGGNFLLLDRLQDPGNMGTIIRTAEAFGIDRVIFSRDCVDIWSPKVLRSTMGSCFRVATEESDNLAETVGQLRRNGVAVYGAALRRDARTPAQLVRGRTGIAVVIGNEGSGITKQVLDACDYALYIPMTDKIESLNASAAAAILLWELYRQGGGAV
ncbi:MAG: RNA methyltransferase [Angelakisella sp.]